MYRLAFQTIVQVLDGDANGRGRNSTLPSPGFLVPTASFPPVFSQPCGALGSRPFLIPGADRDEESRPLRWGTLWAAHWFQRHKRTIVP